MPGPPGEVSITTVQSSFQGGPLPAPSVLEEYDRVVPGLAAKIVHAWETQSGHRQQIELMVVSTEVRVRARGQIYGLIIGVFGLLVAAVLGIVGATVPAAIIGTVDLVALVGLFVVGRSAQRDQDEAST